MQAMAGAEIRQVDVLLVDDDKTGLMILTRSLERANFSVAAVDSANRALELLTSEIKPEVIIADISMPEMDGYEFYRQVRAKGLSDTPFIFCSGRDGALDRVLGLRMGADDYLVKPIVPEEVILKVRLQLTKIQYLRALKTALVRKDSSVIMSGNFGGISVVDVLQTARMLGNGDYAVHLTTEEDSGGVYLKNGQVLHAETGWAIGPKAFSRLLTWEKGSFIIEYKQFDDDRTMVGGLEELMLDHLTQIDEVRQLRSEIEYHGKKFICSPFPEPINEAEMHICKMLQSPLSLDKLFDDSKMNDRTIAEALLQLIKSGGVGAVSDL